MKRKQIIEDIDKIWKDHFDNAVNNLSKGEKHIPVSNKIASYIIKNFESGCGCLPCGCNELGELYCEDHFMGGII